MNRLPPVLVGALALCLVGCVNIERAPTAEQRAAAQALFGMSEKCVYAVRDAKLKYDKAPPCLALGSLSGQYIDLGGGRPDAPPETEYLFAQARVHAWMALALSESKEPALLSIW